MSKQPFSYYGGKQRMASKIIPLIPQHAVYVEPFCGGATLFWRKPVPLVTNSHHYKEVLNDSNGDIANFFTQLRDNYEGLQNLIAHTEYGARVHQESKAVLADPCSSPLRRAWAWMVNINQSFANKANSGWGRSVYGPSGASIWGNRLSLGQYHRRLMGVNIDNTDALKCIADWDSPQTFFYCDPPYPGAYQGHYSGYTLSDFRLLIKALENCQGSFLLSCYHQEEIPADWERFEFTARMTAAKSVGCRSNKSERPSSSRTEVVWRRFNRVPVRQEIQKLYDSSTFDCFARPPHMSQQMMLF